MQLASEICDRASALEFLLGRINYERTSMASYRSGEIKLDRMRDLLALLGDPQLAWPAIHVAGTKGKGSTSAMIASVLSQAGNRTGLYTSPHLERLEERLVIDGRQCSEAEFVRLAADVQGAVAQLDRQAAAVGDAAAPPTFFEITTAMAMLHFARQRVDAAVLEVGLGGRLDSTNVCRPQVCVITSISFDHTRQLGSTLAAIAGEKAGIIKPGVPVISGVVEPEPRDVIAAAAQLQGARLWQRGRDFDFTPAASGAAPAPAEQVFDYWERGAELPQRLAELSLPLLGAHQAANAATAIAALGRLRERGWNISEEAIRSGLAAARCPARIEVVRESPTVIVDVAHNVAAVAALAAVLRQRPAERRILLFASSRDKDVAGMLSVLLPEFDQVVLTKYVKNPRATEVEELLRLAGQILPADARQPAIVAEPDPVAAWKLAYDAAGESDLVCVAGSFFLAAELLPVIRT